MSNLRSLETSAFARRSIWVEAMLPVGLLILFLPAAYHFIGYAVLAIYVCAQALRLFLVRSRRTREQRET